MGPFVVSPLQLYQRLGRADAPVIFDVCKCEANDGQAVIRPAMIVRGADTARLGLAPQAAGLLAISLGNSVLAGTDDHDALARGMAV